MDDACAIFQAGQKRFIAVVWKNCCDCSFHAASGNANFAPEAWRWSGGGEQSDGDNAQSASL